MSDTEVSQPPPPSTPAIAAPAGGKIAPPPSPSSSTGKRSPKHKRASSLGSLALACSIAYVVFGSGLSPGGPPSSSSLSSSSMSAVGLSSRPASAAADASPLAGAPYVSWSSSSPLAAFQGDPSSSLAAGTIAAAAVAAEAKEPWLDRTCRTLPNLSGGRFLSTVCCSSSSSSSLSSPTRSADADADDGARRATLWLVRNDALAPADEDFRIKTTGLVLGAGIGGVAGSGSEKRSGRPIGRSKLARPDVSEAGKSYRFDFVIPEVALNVNDDVAIDAPSLSVWFQSADPIISIANDDDDDGTPTPTPKRYARLFDGPVELGPLLACPSSSSFSSSSSSFGKTALAAAAATRSGPPSGLPLSMRIMRR